MPHLRNLAKKSRLVVRLHRKYSSYRKLLGVNERYLAPNGYWHSYPADSTGEAVPWFSYPAIQFLKGVVRPQWKVLEYGSGYSTVFWNARCARTVSVEHDEHWFNHLKTLHPEYAIQLVKEGFDGRRREVADLIASFEVGNFELPLLPNRSENIEHGLLNREFGNMKCKPLLSMNILDKVLCYVDFQALLVLV